MLQKLKKLFPWILVVILIISLLHQGRKIEALKAKNESIIDSLKTVKVKEESLVDSFFVIRSSYKDSLVTSFQRIDTMNIFEINNLLKQNLFDYENNFGY